MSAVIYQSTTERVKAWLDEDGSTLQIQFNNPDRHNALSMDMWEAVVPLLSAAENDDRIRLSTKEHREHDCACHDRGSENARLRSNQEHVKDQNCD